MSVDDKTESPFRGLELNDRKSKSPLGDLGVLEVAILNVKAGLSVEFEKAFMEAQKIISSMDGYISHQLKKCIEESDKYILLVNWETLEAHTEGFRGSVEYQNWKKLLHHFYEPFPMVEHYLEVKTKAERPKRKEINNIFLDELSCLRW
ncbi:antibiotic biosynthesis monooxygenase [Pedobacter chinensis]|uniref:Antibiotic biosynthesis monooxygenase n=1 Tax=Pedobacter chinensis TaxID=2282421 RepID=A0A369PYP5_9SPHI|nr:antibiotic biosynthesis monooxygenase [Pedobacter chinensis]RDC56107.1 antibiotic biosynthesis monooxygenase [Pedobacter chinensis]